MSTEFPNKPVDSQTDARQANQPLEGQHVLLAEDCIDQGRLYFKFLQSAGAKVALECNGQAVVDAVKKTEKPFDAIVMDFQMPEMDGLISTKQLRDLGYEGTIIAMTAFDSEKLRQSWFQAGCDNFLNKPLKKQELINALLYCTIEEEPSETEIEMAIYDW